MKGILFNTEMVQAILEGRKTSTRRILKHDTNRPNWMGNFIDGTRVGRRAGTIWTGFYKESDIFYVGDEKHIDGTYTKQPFAVGDTLYVRETWTVCKVKKPVKAIPVDFKDIMYFYKADGIANSDGSSIKWHPSIHMPREAARIFLKVTDVRVERVQGITEEGAKAEGIRGYTKDGELYKYAPSDDWWANYCNRHKQSFTGTWWQEMPENPQTAFMYLWNSTIKKQDLNKYGWSANPYVWVISFERAGGNHC